MLEAITTAVRSDEFVLQCVGIEADASPEEHIEILERNPPHVRAKKPGKRLERRHRRAAPVDAREIGIEIDRREHLSLSAGSKVAASAPSRTLAAQRRDNSTRCEKQVERVHDRSTDDICPG